MHRRPGIFQPHSDVGHKVFHRLEGADGFTELLAITAVADRQIHHTLGQTQSLGSTAQRPAVQCRCGNASACAPVATADASRFYSTAQRRREGSTDSL